MGAKTKVGISKNLLRYKNWKWEELIKMKNRFKQHQYKENYFIEQKIYSQIAFALIVVGFLLSPVYFEITFFKDSIQAKNYELNYHNYVMATVIVTTLLSFYYLIMYKYKLFLLYRQYDYVGNYFVFSRIFAELVLEIFIMLLIPNKLFEGKYIQRFNLYDDRWYSIPINNFLHYGMMFRLIPLGKIIIKHDVSLQYCKANTMGYKPIPNWFVIIIADHEWRRCGAVTFYFNCLNISLNQHKLNL